jgi:uncharacterized Zn-binding protein involved in type VI secretion
MANSHRQGDARICGATTSVTGQDFVTVDGQLWSVNGDPNSHGDGALVTSNGWLTIAGKGVIVVGDSAGPDSLCIPVGPPHCAPNAVGFSDMIDVQG